MKVILLGVGVGGVGGTLAFFICNDISHSQIPPKFTHPSIEASGITIHERGQDVYVFNFYIHPGSMQNQITINDFSKIISNYNNNTILVGDFNSKNVMWGSPITCSKGEVIDEFMNKNDLICLNDGTSTFLHNGHHVSSWLDLTLISNGLVAMCEWEVLNDFRIDHIPILTCLNVDGHWKGVPISKPKWNLNKANWPLFNKL